MIDAVTLAVLNGRLEQIADEMDATLYRSAFNPIIAEAHDASHGLYDAESGATLVQGKSGLPIFVGAMSFAVKAVIDRNSGGFKDGDVFIFNDPYEGGTHLNDFKLGQHPYRARSWFVLGYHQSKPPLCAEQRFPVGCIGQQNFVVDKPGVRFTQREQHLIAVLRLRQHVR